MKLMPCLSLYGLAPRAEAKKIIRSGRVTVNGQPVTDEKTEIRDGDRIGCGKEEIIFSEWEYFVLHKPAGLLTATVDRKEETVMTLLPRCRCDVMPVGRLDKDTEGVLLFTNDGALTHRLLAPKSAVEKTYYARLATDLPPDARERLALPIVFSDFTSAPARLTVLSPREACLTVTEGKFHEVKRLFHAVGSDVTYLRRESFASISLADLPKGSVRKLTSSEIEMLKNLVRKDNR